jgi:hypothetical protein
MGAGSPGQGRVASGRGSRLVGPGDKPQDPFGPPRALEARCDPGPSVGIQIVTAGGSRENLKAALQAGGTSHDTGIVTTRGEQARHVRVCQQMDLEGRAPRGT